MKYAPWIDVVGYGSDLMELDAEIYFDGEDVASVTKTIDSDNFASTGTGVAGGPGSLASGSLASMGLSGYVESGSDLDVKLFVKRIPLERIFRTMRIRLVNSQAGVRWRFKTFRINVENTAKDLTQDYMFN